MKPIELDGTTGEGGGQLVRVAISLAALTTQPVTIQNVRGNRGKTPKDGGLKSQHVTSIQWLAEATDADVQGLSVGSKTVTFIPRLEPSQLVQRNVKISAASGAASTLLILQALLPFLVFAGNSSGEPIELEISGGTNVSFSLSYEYADQILLPVLEDRFGIHVERKLQKRGWSLGPQSRGSIWIKVHPVAIGQSLSFKAAAFSKQQEAHKVVRVDVSTVIPGSMHSEVQNTLVRDLDVLFPGAQVDLKLVEDSQLETRWYILLAAHSEEGLRWGSDYLGSMPKKPKMRVPYIAQVSNKLCRDLYEQVSQGDLDEHLQDQIVCFQALCSGYSSFQRGDSPDDSLDRVIIDALGNLELGDSRMRKEKNHEPFGHGSLHTQTARWVTSELLPAVEFYNKGDLVKGVGMSIR